MSYHISLWNAMTFAHATDIGWLPPHDTATVYHMQYGNMGQEGLNSSVPLTQIIYENY